MPEFPELLTAHVDVSVEKQQVRALDGSRWNVTLIVIKVSEVGQGALKHLDQIAQFGFSHAPLSSENVQHLSPSLSGAASTQRISEERSAALQPAPAASKERASAPDRPREVQPPADRSQPMADASKRGPDGAPGDRQGDKQANRSQDKTINPMPPVSPKGDHQTEKLLISFVVLAIATMKWGAQGVQKGQINPHPGKESAEPQPIPQQPPAEAMRLEPQAQMQQQQNSSSNSGREQSPNSFAQGKLVRDKVAAEAKGAVVEIPLSGAENPKIVPQEMAKAVPGQPEMQQGRGALPASLPQQPSGAATQHVEIKGEFKSVPAPQPPVTHAEERQQPPEAIVKGEAIQFPGREPAPLPKPAVALPLEMGPTPPPDQRALPSFKTHVGEGKARLDAIAPKERQEGSSNLNVPHRDESRVNFRMPIAPELPFTREGVMKQQERSNGSCQLEHEGHRLGDLLVMMLAGVLCGARTVAEIFRYLDARGPFFSAWLGLPQGLPNIRTFCWLLNRLDPQHFEELLREALDAKNSLVYQIRCWESDRGVIFGALAGLETHPQALEELIASLDLSHAAVTVDARSLKPYLTQRLKAQDAEYIFAIRGSHEEEYEAVQGHFAEKGPARGHHEAIHTPNRVEERALTVSHDLSWLPSLQSWTGLKAAIRLISNRIEQRRHLTDTRYYLSSLGLKADAMAANVRILNLVEKRVEWLLDCDFARTPQALNVAHAGRNLEALIKCSWNLLTVDHSMRGSFETKRKKALVDNAYLRHLLAPKDSQR